MNCLDETLAEYLDGRLHGRKPDREAAHAADCEACYFTVAETGRMPESVVDSLVQTRSWGELLARHEWLTMPRVVWPAAALATAATVWLSVGTLWLLPTAPELQQLVAEVGTNRTIEARLAGGFAHGSLRGPVRRTETLTVSPDVRIAAAQAEKSLAAKSAPPALQVLGVAALLTGDLDRAIPTMERWIGSQAPDVRFLSDLSAAYLTRAARDHRPQDPTKALAAAERALRIDAKLVEAGFNRSDALQRLSLTNEARDARQDYLTNDSASPWADEARMRLRTLTTGDSASPR
jgi:tetratricopeptide (TPR) repeat protein